MKIFFIEKVKVNDEMISINKSVAVSDLLKQNPVSESRSTGLVFTTHQN